MFGIDDAIGAAGGLVGGLIGNLFGSGTDKKALEAQQQAIDELRRVNPEAADAWEKAIEDQRTKQAQMGALAQMQGIAAEGGMDTQSRVALQQAQDQQNAQNRMQQDALRQEMAARGGAGGGSELASRLVAQQGGAQRASSFGAQAASDARQRALQAIAGGSDIASQTRGQDLAFMKAKNDAKNMVGMFNANQRLRRAGAVADQYGNLASGLRGQAQQQRNSFTGMGSAAGGVAAGINKLASGGNPGATPGAVPGAGEAPTGPRMVTGFDENGNPMYA